MKTYNIPVIWQCSAVIPIQADSLEEAIKLAHDAPLPTNGEYIDDSFEVDEEGIPFHNGTVE